MTPDSFESAQPSPWRIPPERVDQKSVQKVGKTFGRSEKPDLTKDAPFPVPAQVVVAASPPPKPVRRASDDRLPPHSPDAEQGILGCLLFDAETCYDVAYTRIRDAEAFYEERHRVIFETIRALRADKKPVDYVNVVQRLRDHKYLEGVGGIEYLDSMMESVTSTHNLPSYIDTLLEKLMFRKLLQNCTTIQQRILDGGFNSKEIAQGIEVDLTMMSLALGGARNGHLPKIVPGGEFVSVEIPAPSELIHGILHQGTKMVLGGGSKSFKTWVLLDLALSVSARLPWLNFPTAGGKVLFVNLEIQPAFFQQRLMEVAYCKGIKGTMDMIHVWNLRGHSAPYSQIIPKIVDRIKEQGYSLVIFDPIYKLYGLTDENSAGEVAQLLNTLETVCVETGAAVAFGAHFSKGNQSAKESIDRISGSGVFGRDPDSILVFTKHESEDCFTVEPTLRNLKPVPAFVVRWQFPLMQRDEQLDPAQLKQPGAKPKANDPGALLNLLLDGPLTNEEWQSQAAGVLGISRATFYRYRADLKDSGKILFSRIDDKWQVLVSK